MTYTLKSVHFIVYSLTKKIKSPNGKTKNKHTHTHKAHRSKRTDRWLLEAEDGQNG